MHNSESFMENGREDVNLPTDEDMYNLTHYDVSGLPYFLPTSRQALNVLGETFAISSIVANIVSLMAIGSVCHRCSDGAPSTNLRLICSLSAADLLTGLCGVLADHNPTPIVGIDSNPCIDLIAHKLRIAAHLLTLSSMLGLAIDYYLAICRPLFHLQQVVASSVNVVIVVTWVICIVCSFSDVMVTAISVIECPDYRQARYEFCGSVQCINYSSNYLVYPLAVIVLVTMLMLYAFTCRQIYNCRRLHQHNGHQFQRLMIRRTKKAMFTSSIVVGMFVACWLPYCLFNLLSELLVHLSYGYSLSESAKVMSLLETIRLLESCFYVLLLFNGVIDPLVYALRMRQVRQGYKHLGGLLFGKIYQRCWFSSVTLSPHPRLIASNPMASSVTTVDASAPYHPHGISLSAHRTLTICRSDPTLMASADGRVAMTTAQRTLTTTSHDRATSWIARHRRHGDSPQRLSTRGRGNRLPTTSNSVVVIELSEKCCPSPVNL